MASERKISGFVVLVSWTIVAVMAVFFVTAGWDWYHNGHLRLCLPEDSLEPPFGHYRPPSDPRELLIPRYWCMASALRAAQREKQNKTSSVESTIWPNFDTLDETYTGLHPFWGDDIISNFFHDLATLAIRFTEMFNPWFRESFAPGWNAFFADEENPSAEAHRFALAGIAAALFSAALAAAAKTTLDWAHEMAGA